MLLILNLIFLAGLVVVALAVLVWLWWHGRPPHYVLGAVPPALLFLTQTTGSALWQMLAGFRQIAETGVGGRAHAAALSLGVARHLWLATLAFTVALSVAAVLQFVLRRRPPSDAFTLDMAQTSRRAWGNSLLIVSSLLVVPVAVLVYRAERLARVTMLVADSPPSEVAAIATAFAGPGVPLGDAIGDQLRILVPASTWLSHVLLVLSIVNLVLIAFRTASRPRTAYAWSVFCVAWIGAVWTLFRLGADIRWFAGAVR